jgi:membrane AbrB-like protein
MNTLDLVLIAIGCGVLAQALARYAPKSVPTAGRAAQGVLGVYTGLLVHSVSFDALGSHWPMVIAIAVGTLAISVAGGALLGLHPDVSPLTGALSLVAGGASGVVAIAKELGGDDRIVAAVQYLRVAMIMASMPVIVAVVFHSTEDNASHMSESGTLPWYLSLPLIAVIIAVGTVVARTVRLPGAGLLGPMAIAIALDLTGMTWGLAVPMLLVQAGIMLIGWQAGLDFTKESLTTMKRILPAAIALIVVLNLAAAGFGVVLAKVAGLSMLDGYLATSPGGVYAVLATAVGTGSTVTFIMAAQVIRIVLMLFAAPLIAKAFLKFASQDSVTSPAAGGQLAAVAA